MKKIIITIIILAIGFSFTACNSKNNGTSGKNSTETKTAEVKKAALGDLNTIPSFKVKDINNNDVTEKILKDKKVTMINIWGTFCSPCVEEMPLLQKLYDEYTAKGFNLIGVVSDGEMNKEDALDILKKLNVTFVNLIPDEKFQNDFVSKTDVVPTSVFVNSNGEILETVTGSRTKEEYKNIIEKYLQ
ncbi:TlpA family protein disulfide reductase [Clostridium sp.]|uniref:TlpA family protein disulfide reductase n=1 Tax=Clostridium sp. TaxID=1506 RepID=UPI002FDEB909